MAGRDRVAFLGLGIMGWPMAASLVRSGFEVIVWNRTAERAERFAAEHGAEVAESPAWAARGADAVITMVVDSPQVEEVVLGPRGAAEGLSEGGLVIDMSTIAPRASRRIAERLAQSGIVFVDAPVSGSRPKAEDGTLTIMVGASDAAFARALPVFEAMGERIVHVGPQGHGVMAKVVANTVTAVNAAALAEALTMARAAGLEPDAFLEVAGAGSSGSTVLELKARPMLERDFEPLFKLEQMLKDVRHCLDEARAARVELRLAQAAERLYAEAEAEGLGERDFAAVVTVPERSGA